MKRRVVLMVALSGLLAACAGPTPTPHPTPTPYPTHSPQPTYTPRMFISIAPTVEEILAQGDELLFEICGESTTWVRPSEQEQGAKWWDSGRYAGADEEVIKYPWTHTFLVAYGHASTEYDLTNLSGLWTLPEDVRAKCFEPEPHDAVLKLERAEAWVLLHRVQSIKRLDTLMSW